MIAMLNNIAQHYKKPKTFMVDEGSHFTANKVKMHCERKKIKHVTTPAYAPWVNRLVEEANKILLGHLKRLCTPDLNFDERADINPETIP